VTEWAAKLDALPRLSLLAQATPLHAAERLSAAVGGPRLWLKRDDLIPTAFGGNKVRALDLVVGDAVSRGADALITGAGPLSNHVRAAAGIAGLAGLDCIAVYWGAKPRRAEGNYRLAVTLGAQVHFTDDPDRASVDREISRKAFEIDARGGRPYVVPRGGACPLAALAHVLATQETLAQCAALGVAPTRVVMAVGGSATLAGWLLGTALLGAPWRIEAITVSRPAEEAAARAHALAEDAAALIGARPNLNAIDCRVHGAFIGPGYGVPSPEGEEAIAAVARAEAIFLDPVYTGKAMGGYLNLLGGGAFADVDDVLFLHTGGAPALFASFPEQAS
jgi:D-cysteine desulfhydrase